MHSAGRGQPAAKPQEAAPPFTPAVTKEAAGTAVRADRDLHDHVLPFRSLRIRPCPLCRERLARLQAAAQPAGAAPTFSPAVNERSLRLALSKQIRELLNEVPAYQRLGAARRRPPRSDAGEDVSPPWLTPQSLHNT